MTAATTPPDVHPLKGLNLSLGVLPKRAKESLVRRHEELCKTLAEILAVKTGAAAKLRLASMAQGSFGDYLKSLDRPAALGVFSIETSAFKGFLRLDNSILRLLLDKILGGDSSGNVDQPLTAIELKVAEDILGLFLSPLNALWETIGEYHFLLQSCLSGNEAASLFPPEETLLIAAVEASVGAVSGRVDACVPFAYVKPLLGALEKAEERAFGSLDDPKFLPVIKKKMENVSVKMRACLGRLDFPLRHLMDLAAGDVIPLGRIDRDIVVEADGVPVFAGQPGTSNGRMAVQIFSVIGRSRA